MRSKTVPERMTTGHLRDTGGANGKFDGVSQILFAIVVAAFFAAARIDGKFLCGEDVLPSPFAGRVPIFSVQGTGEVNGPGNQSRN